MTWAQLAEAVGRPAAWTTSALLGQQPMTAAQATAAGSLLELGEDVTQALQLQPARGALACPLIASNPRRAGQPRGAKVPCGPLT